MRIMRKMFNIVVHDPDNGSYGDCHRNCISMLLGLNQHDVPHFYEDADGVRGRQRIEEFLSKRGLASGEMVFNAENTNVEQILSTTGSMMRNIPLILSGESQKGCNHSVVILNGEIWCDPSGSGVIGPCLTDNPEENFYWVTFISPIPDEIISHEDEIFYAKTGGPPENWHSLRIFYEGVEKEGFSEVNADEGWGVIAVRDDNGNVLSDGDEIRTTKLHGKFRIVRR